LLAMLELAAVAVLYLLLISERLGPEDGDGGK